MEIGLYKDSMKTQVANLFSMQYGVKKEDFERLIDNFYEHPFQKDKCIRLVATEGDKVIGFQSFFYWAYTCNNKTYNSYQSGNSLVHPDYRGKGIFQNLLNYLDNQREELKIDFLMGFPVEQSLNSFLRNKWKNIFDLQWYVKTLNPLSLLLPLNINKLKSKFPNRELFVNNMEESDYFRISNTPKFVEWRTTYFDNEKYFSFYFKRGKEELLFKLKINIRKKFIKELIIGDIITTTYECEFILNAIAEFIKAVKKLRFITLITIAINEKCNYNMTMQLLKQGFTKIDKRIHFIVKPFLNEELFTTVDKWIIYRGDVDSW